MSPVAEEKLPDRRFFDVYAVMILLTCAALGGGIWFAVDELQKNWYGGEELTGDYAINITQPNPNPARPDIIGISDRDLDDYRKAKLNADGVENAVPPNEAKWRWPSGYDFVKYAIDPLKNNSREADADSETGRSLKTQLDALMSNYDAKDGGEVKVKTDGDAPAATPEAERADAVAPAPVAPAPEAPAGEAEPADMP
jgi:hypothetical protein